MKKLVLTAVGFFLMVTTAFAERLLITDHAGTQGKGNARVEAGLSFVYDKDKVDELTTVKTKGGEAVVSLAVGLIDSLDVVMGVPYAWYSIKENGARVGREEGVADIALDVKWRFFEKDGLSLALKPGISLPAGDDDRGLGAGRAGYRLFFIGTKELEPFAIDANLGYIRNENKFNERTDLWHVSIAGEAELLKGLKLMANIGAERNPDPGSNTHPAFALGGLAYNIMNNITIDAGVKYGLTATEDDWTFLTGLAVRF